MAGLAFELEGPAQDRVLVLSHEQTEDQSAGEASNEAATPELLRDRETAARERHCGDFGPPRAHPIVRFRPAEQQRGAARQNGTDDKPDAGVAAVFSLRATLKNSDPTDPGYSRAAAVPEASGSGQIETGHRPCGGLRSGS